MNILVVCQYFWPETFRINDVCLGLLQKGHEVTVLTGIPNYPEGRFYRGYSLFKPLHEEYKGIKIVRIPLIPRHDGKGFQLALNYISFAINSTILAPFLCRGKYDLIFVYQLSPATMALPAVFLKLLRKTPLVHYVLDLWPESMSATGTPKSSIAYWLIDKLVRFIYKRSDMLLVSSFGFMSSIASKGVSESKIKYWPQWADSNNYTDNVSSEIKDSMPEGFKIVFAGNIGDAQGFETILSAAAFLRDDGYKNIHWIILGDGRMKKWVEEEASRRGLKENFHIMGRKPVDMMPDYFRLADGLLVTLKKDEIFSLTLPAKVQSYLASGRPILAALDGEGARVVKEAGAGLVCASEDSKALSELVIKLYGMSDDDRRALGDNGKDYFYKNFNREILLESLNQIFLKYKV